MSSGACPGDPNPCRTFVLGVFSPATPSSVSIHCIHFPSLPTEPVASAESEHNFQWKTQVDLYRPWTRVRWEEEGLSGVVISPLNCNKIIKQKKVEQILAFIFGQRDNQKCLISGMEECFLQHIQQSKPRAKVGNCFSSVPSRTKS